MKIDDLEKIADDYHSSIDVKDKLIEDISQEYFCDWLKQSFSKNLNVCELGYGEGITSSLLNNFFKKYHVIEGAPSLVKKAKKSIPNLSITNSLFEDYKPIKKYDLILALHILEHVDNPLTMLHLIKNWIKNNGNILILVPNNQSIHRLLAQEMGLINNLSDLSERDKLVGHKRVYNINSLKKEIEKAGFKIVFKKGFFFKPLPNSMMINFKKELLLAMNRVSNEFDLKHMANICVCIQIK